MGLPVVGGATISCPMGLGLGLLNASQLSVLLAGVPAVTIQDVAPMANLGPCGMCTSMAFPATAAATAAALGVLTPMPCIPAPVGLWSCSPGPLIAGKPGLMNDGSLVCAYGGSIRIVYPGQSMVLY